MEQQPPAPMITSAEWLSSGIVVHFDQGARAYFTAQFLFSHRYEQPVPDVQNKE